jgi:hypothetical protein
MAQPNWKRQVRLRRAYFFVCFAQLRLQRGFFSEANQVTSSETKVWMIDPSEVVAPMFDARILFHCQEGDECMRKQ